MPAAFEEKEKQDKKVTEEVTEEETKTDEVEENPSQEEAKEDFEQMLETTFIDTSKIVEGDVVTGKVIAINDNYIFVSLGGKNEAYAERDEYETKTGKLKVEIGDELRGFVVKKTDSEIVISKSLNRKYVDKGFLREAYEKKVPVKGKMISTVKGGFSVEILGTRAFCSFSQADIRYISDPQTMIGHYYDFEITEISSDMRNIVLSRKALLEKDLKEMKKETMEKLEVGAVFTGIVSRIAEFGAFVDLGGIDGLLHISQISWIKVDNPRDVVKIGEEIKVKVIGIDGEKIALSMKELQPDPMIKALEDLKEDDIVKCRILRNESFGSFCEIKPGVEGLIPISELLRGSRVNDPSEVVSVGDFVEAQIIKINRDERKISLSLKALKEDPWDFIDDNVKEGDEIEGVVESITNFGVFVRIQEGLTGLLPKSKITRGSVKYGEEDVGKTVNLRVQQIDKQKRRISLEPLDMAPSTAEYRPSGDSRSREKQDWKKYVKNVQEVPEDNPFSDL
ncbi:MAG: S1 RNA-binding domain-containing protein [Candidatus Cloacimonetes bacterium]|nr:S1 RNA-binding domain-containing protein [Candidatus Cloacimonadota bacterium]